MDLLDKMATFVRVVEAGSLSAAAKQLRISAAAVSRQIALLEGELGATLLLRSTRKMSVAPVGRTYYERCLRILREVDDAQAVGRGSGLDGMLRLNVPITFGLAAIAPLVPDLAARHPELKIDLRVEDRLVDLVLEGVDVAIRVGGAPPPSAHIIATTLLGFRRVIVAAPRYLAGRRPPRTPADLHGHPAMTHAGDSDAWTLVRTGRAGRSARRVTARLAIAFRSNALHALRAVAIAGTGLALLPDFLVAADLAAGRLVRVMPAWHSELVHVRALYRTEARGEHRIRALIAYLREALA